MDQNPCGLHVESRDNRFDRRVFFDHIILANYSTLAFMDDFQLAMDSQGVLPNAVISHRVYEKDNPGPPLIGSWAGAPQTNDHEAIKVSAMAYINSREAEWANPNPLAKQIYLNVNCEPTFTRSQCEWYVEMMHYCAPKGIRLLLGNFGSGRVKSGQGDDPNEWLTDGAELLQTFYKYQHTGLFLLGLHEYTTFYAWAVSNGQAPERPDGYKFENAPNPVDFTKPQWHIGRLYGVVTACQKLNPPIDPPNIVISEALLDDMQDISKRMTVSLKKGLKSPNGWWTLEPQFRQWYPNRDPGEVYAGMSQWTWEAVYAPLGCVIGINNFTWNDASSKDWENFRVDNSIPYRKSMEAYRPMSVLPVYVKDPTWSHRPQLIGGPSGINLREQPNRASKSFGVLPAGTQVEYFPASKTVDGWVYIEKGSDANGGWISFSDANLIDLPLPPPIVTQPPPAILVDWRTKFTDVQLKIINAAVAYSKDSYPDPGSHLKLIIATFVEIQ